MMDPAAASSTKQEREREKTKTSRPRAAAAAAAGRAPPEEEDSAAAKKPEAMVVALMPTLLAPACPQQSCSLRLPERLEGRVEDAPPVPRGGDAAPPALWKAGGGASLSSAALKKRLIERGALTVSFPPFLRALFASLAACRVSTLTQRH